MSLLRNGLPQGTEILTDFEDAPPGDIYYVVWGENYYCLLPNAESAKVRLDDLGLSRRLRLTNGIASINTGDFNVVPVTLSAPHGPIFPSIDRQINDVYFIAFPGSQKQIVLIHDRHTWDILCVAKTPMSDAAAAALLNEYEALSALQRLGKPFAPEPLALRRDQKGIYAGITLQSGIRGEPLPANDDAPIPKDVLDILFQLRNGSQINLGQFKNRLTQRARAHPGGEERYEMITRILSTVRHDGNVASSMFHGDFRPANMLRSDEGQICVLDWEFSSPQGIGFLDAARYLLEPGYRDEEVRSFERLFTARRLSLLEETKRLFFDGPQPSLWELLALHVVQHFLDRDQIFFGGRVDRMRAIIASDWPG